METEKEHQILLAEPQKAKAKDATRQGIAIIGFVAIAIIGMTIAVYAARFVPNAISGVASASVYLSSIFIPAEGTPNEEPVEEPVEEIPADDGDVVITPVEEEPEAPVVTPTKPTTPTKPVVTPVVYSGFSDLTVAISNVGYCTSPAGTSFVPSTSVPRGTYGGVRFITSNVGTNISGLWQFRLGTPTQPSYVYDSPLQRSLKPGDSLDMTLCFNAYQTQNTGTLSITVDSPKSITETNEGNNVAARVLTIMGVTNSNSNNNSNDDDLWCDITASDRSIDEGDTTTLRWDTEDADDARINQGVGRVDEDGGSERVSPNRDTTYRLTVENDDGDEETCSVTIRVDED